MQQPQGFVVQEKENHMCLLKKSLYGLKQSPRQWYKRFDTVVLKHGYSMSDCDGCVYLVSSKMVRLFIYSYMLMICLSLLRVYQGSTS